MEGGWEVSEDKFLIDIEDYRMLLLWSDGYMMWEGSETVDYEGLGEDMKELRIIKEKYKKAEEK